jgi:hypothetical protein
MCARLITHSRPSDLDASYYLNRLLNPTTSQSHTPSFPARLFVKFIIKLENCHLYYASFTSNRILPQRSFKMCYIQYIMYDRCEHWVKQCLPNGEPVRLCRQAEEERLGFACPDTQRVHVVVERSQGFCKGCEFTHVYS